MDTIDNSMYNKDLTGLVKGITVNEGGYRLGLKKETIKKHCQQGHFVTRKEKMNGGFGYKISVESMFSYYETTELVNKNETKNYFN